MSYGIDPKTHVLKIMEENHYYPFGFKHANYNSGKKDFEKESSNNNIALRQVDPGDNPLAEAPFGSYQYKYNGKEYQDELGLNLYAMDMRQYDPAIGRWIVQDPIVHHSQSSYCAFDNNPVLWTDPSGAAAEEFDIMGRVKRDANGNYIAPDQRKEKNYGDSGVATKNDRTKTIEVKSELILYGSEVGNVDIQSIAMEIQNSYNSAKATINYNNSDYNVIFSISVQVVSEEEAKKIASTNTDVSVNFIRIENKSSSIDRSFMELGGNAGVWLLSDGLGNSTTTVHEMGHGFGLEHSSGDQRGSGIPDIMAARGTLVDAQFQYNSRVQAGAYGGTINPKYRQVLQSNISMIFNNITFTNGKANLGNVTNTIYDKNGKPQ